MGIKKILRFPQDDKNEEIIRSQYILKSGIRELASLDFFQHPDLDYLVLRQPKNQFNTSFTSFTL